MTCLLQPSDWFSTTCTPHRSAHLPLASWLQVRRPVAPDGRVHCQLWAALGLGERGLRRAATVGGRPACRAAEQDGDCAGRLARTLLLLLAHHDSRRWVLLARAAGHGQCRWRAPSRGRHTPNPPLLPVLWRSPETGSLTPETAEQLETFGHAESAPADGVHLQYFHALKVHDATPILQQMSALSRRACRRASCAPLPLPHPWPAASDANAPARSSVTQGAATPAAGHCRGVARGLVRSPAGAGPRRLPWRPAEPGGGIAGGHAGGAGRACSAMARRDAD